MSHLRWRVPRCATVVALLAVLGLVGCGDDANLTDLDDRATTAVEAPTALAPRVPTGQAMSPDVPAATALSANGVGTLDPAQPTGRALAPAAPTSVDGGFDCRRLCAWARPRLIENLGISPSRIDCSDVLWHQATTCEACLQVLGDLFDVEFENGC
ncbi:MAG: hypothetical protein IPG96_12550 [Proteobacteria bacterium]|nr:hypothetical protein [Pseudomonadota bacterium]